MALFSLRRVGRVGTSFKCAAGRNALGRRVKMDVIKILKLLAIILYVGLLLAAAALLPQHQKLTAATGTAKCPGGYVITCKAFRCECVDNLGCTGYDSNGKVIESQTTVCPNGASTAYARLGTYSISAAWFRRPPGDEAGGSSTRR